jgi:hypothetical protein
MEESITMFRLIKLSVAGLVVAVVGGFLLRGSDFPSMIKTSARCIKRSVKQSVPVEFERRRAKEKIGEILPDLRPGCLKRTTLGKYTLEIFPEGWESFVRFHVEALGCRFCQANLVELNQQVQSHDPRNEQLFQSTIGFLPVQPKDE